MHFLLVYIVTVPTASMEARRSTLGVAVMNDQIFAVGGFDGSCGLNTAEVLDMSVAGSQEWRTIASMSTRRSSVGVGCCALNELLCHTAPGRGAGRLDLRGGRLRRQQ